ncbi:hypothetical protein QOT17_002498 [Balamuthia mandrillaris]
MGRLRFCLLTRGSTAVELFSAPHSSSSLVSSATLSPFTGLSATRSLTYSSRLKAVAAMIDREEGPILDIGYDHAHLLHLLHKEGRTNLWGTDLNTRVKATAYQKLVWKPPHIPQLLVANGFAPFEPGFIKQAVMAGLGQDVMVNMLDRFFGHAKQLRRLVLCPTSLFSPTLREYLKSHHWRIVQEDLVAENQQFYTVIAAQPMAADQQAPPLEGVSLYFGPILTTSPSLRPLMKEYVKEVYRLVPFARGAHLGPTLLQQLEELDRQQAQPHEQELPSASSHKTPSSLPTSPSQPQTT